MKGPLIKTKGGQYAWLQFLALVLSGVAYVVGSMTVAVAMLLVATVFGGLSMMHRVRQAKQQLRQQAPRGQSRR